MPQLNAHQQTGQVLVEYLIAGVVLSSLLFIASYLVRGAIHYQNRYETLLSEAPPVETPPLKHPEALSLDDWETESTFNAPDSDWQAVPGVEEPRRLGPEKTVLKVDSDALIGRKIWYLSKDGNLSIRWTEDGLPRLPSSEWITLPSFSSTNSNVIKIDWPSASFPESGHYRFEVTYENQTDQPYPMVLSVDDAHAADFRLSPNQEPGQNSAGLLKEQSPLVFVAGGSHRLRLTSARAMPAPRPAPMRLTFWREETGQSDGMDETDFGLGNLTASGSAGSPPGPDVPPPLGGATPGDTASPEQAGNLTDHIDVPTQTSQCVAFFDESLFSAGRPSSVQLTERYQVRIEYVRPPAPSPPVEPAVTAPPLPPLPAPHMASRTTTSAGATGNMIESACNLAASGQLSNQWSYGITGNGQLNLTVDRTGPPQTETQVWTGP